MQVKYETCLPLQDALASPTVSTQGGQARLAASQVAALQGRLLGNPASLQLTAVGLTAGHLASPASNGSSAGSAAAAASRSLAAMLRVAAVEAPTTAFSTLHVSPFTPALLPRAQSAASSSKQADLAMTAGVHGRALTGEIWMAPRLVSRPHVVYDTAREDESQLQATGCPAFEGSIIVTGSFSSCQRGVDSGC